MRIRKAICMAVLALSMAVTALAASDSVSVNALFVVPSFISLSVIGNGDVDFGDILGNGIYNGDNTTDLRVLSTVAWSITSDILWNDVATLVPAGVTTVGEEFIGAAIGIPYTNGGSWGLTDLTVSYAMTVTDEDMDLLPFGNYSFVIQYTATTD